MNSEYCTKCGGVMVWRSTNNITRLSKWKCRDCGHISTMVLPEPEPVVNVPVIPNYYYQRDGKYIVRKKRNNETVYVGAFQSEDMAKEVVEGMKSVDWNKTLIPEVLKGLGIGKVNRQWCYV